MENFPKDEENLNEEIEVQIIENKLGLYRKTLDILKDNHLCDQCLGRQFSFLGTATDNASRTKAILLSLTMECHATLLKNTIKENYTLLNKEPLEILHIINDRMNFTPAKQLLKKWYQKHPDCLTQYGKIEISKKVCNFCIDLLIPSSIDEISRKIDDACKDYDFDNFLIGTYLNPILADKEDEFRSRYNIRNGESFKANLNRLVGKQLQKKWNKVTKYEKPDINFTIDLRNTAHIKIELKAAPLFVKAKYLKFVRDLPQTHWHCPKCRGKGQLKYSREVCDECNGTGDMYATSIQDLIGNEILKASKGKSAILHGAGREDMDARCLGSGRPFVIEIKNPKFRKLDLLSITQQINSLHHKKIHISTLTESSKKDVIRFKNTSPDTKKKYHALVYLFQPISRSEFEIKSNMVIDQLLKQIIKQRTPLRVVHRRADRTREKKIFSIESKYIDSVHILFKINAQGGTYIKELISGDQKRTNPSIQQIFNIPMKCVELDVVEIDIDENELIE